MAGIESRRHSSGVASATPDGSEHERDTIGLVAQVPTPGDRYGDCDRHDTMAMTNPSDPLAL